MTAKQPWIETPLIWSKSLSQISGCNIYLKLENLQPSGSFKSRGMSFFIAAHLPKNHQEDNVDSNPTTTTTTTQTPTTTHFFCSSGGNAGLGCVSAAVTYGCPATIVVPNSTSSFMISKLEKAGATKVIQTGASWFEADEFLRNELLPAAKRKGLNAVYVPPFDAPEIWEGNSTMIDEIVRQLPRIAKHYPSQIDDEEEEEEEEDDDDDSTTSQTTIRSSEEEEEEEEEEEKIELPDAIICSVGGGGLLNGIMQGLSRYSSSSSSSSSLPPPASTKNKNKNKKKKKKKHFPHTKVLAIETSGADALFQSIQAQKLITLPAITSIATTLGARTVSSQAFKYASLSCSDDDKRIITCAVLTDQEAVEACKRFADDERFLVEPACAVSLAVIYSGKLKSLMPGLRRESQVVVVVCGGSGLSLGILNGYIEEYL